MKGVCLGGAGWDCCQFYCALENNFSLEIGPCGILLNSWGKTFSFCHKVRERQLSLVGTRTRESDIGGNLEYGAYYGENCIAVCDGK